MNVNFTCRLQEDQGQEADSDKEEKEGLKQPVFGIGGNWWEWEGYPDITW